VRVCKKMDIKTQGLQPILYTSIKNK